MINESGSDALVFFGATGDLAYKKIFPALLTMIKRGHLNAPIIGVVKSAWSLDQLRMRARESLEKQGKLDRDARIAGDEHAESLLRERAERTRASFNLVFWNTELECLYDVVNGCS